jgi:hypothetical protein
MGRPQGTYCSSRMALCGQEGFRGHEQTFVSKTLWTPLCLSCLGYGWEMVNSQSSVFLAGIDHDQSEPLHFQRVWL